jgi:hypothetical protein
MERTRWRSDQAVVPDGCGRCAMLITNLTSGRVVASVMTMGVLTATIPVRDLRDFSDQPAGATGDGRVAATSLRLAMDAVGRP